MKFLDLDRCYSITRVPVQGGGVLCLFTLHLSAYTSDGEIAVTQLRIMLADMARERAAGNYVIAGGDFNKDILQDSSRYTGVPGKGYSWAKPFPLDALPEGFTLIAPFDPEHIVMSCRASDAAYCPGKTFTVTLDAFIVSDNVKSEMCRVIDAGFKNSDHNPIEMRFRLL